MAGKPGDGVYQISDKQKIREIVGEGKDAPDHLDITFKGGYPDDGPYLAKLGGLPGQVKIGLDADSQVSQGVRRRRDDNSADEKYAAELNENNVQSPDGGKWTAADVKAWRTKNKFTWHHHEDMTTMQLVPRGINRVPHLGGRGLKEHSLNLPYNAPPKAQVKPIADKPAFKNPTSDKDKNIN